MKKKLISSIFASVLLVSLLFAPVGSVFASQSNPVEYDLNSVLLTGNVTNGRSIRVLTMVAYNPSYTKAEGSAVKYPGGQAFISKASVTSYSGSADLSRSNTGYTGKITAYGYHEVYSNGKMAWMYTQATNQ